MSAGLAGVPRDAWLLYGVLVLTQAGYSVLVPLLPSIQRELSLGYGEASLAWTAFGFARLVVDIPAGALIARFELRRLLVASIAIGTAGLFYTAFAPSFAHIVASRVVFGASSSLVSAILLAWLVEIATPGNRGRVMAFQEACWSFTAMLAPAAAGLIAAAAGWRPSMIFGGVLSLLALVFLLPLPSVHPRRPKPGRDTAVSVPAVLRAGGPLLIASYVVAFIIFFNRNGFVTTFTPLFAGSILQFGPDTIGLGVAIYNTVSFVAVTASGPILDRIGRTSTVVPALVATAVGDLLFLLATGFPGYALGLAVIATNASANGVPPALIGDLVPQPLRPMAAAMYRFSGDIAILVAPVFAGFLFDRFGATLAIPIMAAVVLLSLLAYLGLALAGRHTKHRAGGAGAPAT